MKIAFLYGGQGSQVENMGLDLYEEYPVARKFYNDIDLDFDLKDMSFKGSKEMIDRTEYTQSLMVAFQIAVTKILEANSILPSITAGLSLGEFSSLYASKVLGEKELLELVRYRSLKMEEVSKKIESSMIAVFSDDLDYLENLCLSVSNNEEFAQVTNINTRSQIVISGIKNKIKEIEVKLKEDKIRSTRLNTSGPFHTSYMESVSENLYEYLAEMKLEDAEIDIIHNLYGEKRENLDVKKTLAEQVSNKVLFKSTLENLLEEDLDLIVEIGHGDVIKGFMRRIDRKTKVFTLNSVSGIEELFQEVERLNG